MAKLGENKLTVHKGALSYEVTVVEQLVEGQLMAVVTLVPGSVKWNHWHPGFWLAVIRGIVKTRGRLRPRG